jgi:hypothetical protein
MGRCTCSYRYNGPSTSIGPAGVIAADELYVREYPPGENIFLLGQAGVDCDEREKL